MMIILNGEPYQTNAQHLATLVDELGLAGKRIAIEVDQQLIPKSRHAVTPLSAQLQIEIVHAVGGG